MSSSNSNNNSSSMVQSLGSDIRDNVCEVCGKPAISKVADVKELDPVRGNDGNWYSRKVLERACYLCKAHDRSPKLTPRFRNINEMRDWIEKQQQPNDDVKAT